MHSTTPRKITGLVRSFLASLQSAGTPVLLPFIAASPDYCIGYCLSNCEAECRRTNAGIVFGWVVWESRAQSFIEAEFHSVVRREGQLQDITPRRDGEKLVLFAPDLVRVAVRRDDHTWDTWTNHKKQGAFLEPTRQILIQDLNSNVWGGTLWVS
jgi:hypothetical protein